MNNVDLEGDCHFKLFNQSLVTTKQVLQLGFSQIPPRTVEVKGGTYKDVEAEEIVFEDHIGKTSLIRITASKLQSYMQNPQQQ